MLAFPLASSMFLNLLFPHHAFFPSSHSYSVVAAQQLLSYPGLKSHYTVRKKLFLFTAEISVTFLICEVLGHNIYRHGVP